jgi:hypothetical protein
METITPTCRYGHGDLVKVDHDEVGTADFLIPTHQPMKVFNFNGKMATLPAGFVLNIYKCMICSYIELHDTEVSGVTEVGEE